VRRADGLPEHEADADAEAGENAELVETETADTAAEATA
jgi:hypothetical protein